VNRCFLKAILCAGLGICVVSCDRKVAAKDIADKRAGPVPAKVESDFNAANFKVEHPEQFALITAGEHVAAPELNVTGAVSPDVSRQVPVPSLATGRVAEIDARLGDTVQKGQLLFKVRSTDVAGAYSDYQKAVKTERLTVKNEQLAKIQLDRAMLLLDDGAIPKSAAEIAQNNYASAQTAVENARVDIQTAAEHLRVLGADPALPSGTAIVEVRATASGVITDQQITDQSGVQALTPPNPFTISDLSRVWIVCDVYENNLAQVRIGESADIHLAAWPERVLRARVANILPVLDANLRTAKVRLEVENPGILRFGMFVTAAFHGEAVEHRAVVPATAILHLHDREWVYTPAGDGRFRRVEIEAGAMLPDSTQEVLSGVKPGDQVVANALVFQNTVEQ
jgi:cobalt-zinc-cadmium efflux system membrane fusion protein